MKANHETKWVPIVTGRGRSIIKVEPGQFIFGRKSAANELKMKTSTVQDRMNFLAKHENIVMQSVTHCSIVSIVNWDTYQSNKNQSITQSVNQASTKHQPSITNNNDNNYNNTLLSVATSDMGDEEKNIPGLPPEPTNPDKPKKPPVPVRKINDLYNDILSENGGLLLSEFPDLVNDKIKARWNMKDSSSFEQNEWEAGQRFNCLEWWESFFEYICGCDWLMGRVKGANWKADFGWILKKENFLKIISGRYENKKRF